MISITGTVGSSGKYLVTGIPVETKTYTVLKIAFENNTGGTNLALFAGTDAEFASGSWRHAVIGFRRSRLHIPDDHRYPKAIRQGHLRSPCCWFREFAVHTHGRLITAELVEVLD